ncbi:hypothetical protein CVT26_008008 [Gymnopilus dilepis]|uniref:Uncharacterized protein n=1 Tax=Gymnopilus dilepis TaxID=231916 RepID=A0A409YJG2_9AGAR|nr:hypothetical protein CVT26_008008 [Gymnopilus dilepis]
MANSSRMMENYEKDLQKIVRSSSIPFPPVIFARGAACLIAETYISSNPASGLVLISPPISNADLVGTMLPTGLKEFDYEVGFPIAVVDTFERMALLRQRNRVCRSEAVDILRVKTLTDEETFVAVERWLDQLGI